MFEGAKLMTAAPATLTRHCKIIAMGSDWYEGYAKAEMETSVVLSCRVSRRPTGSLAPSGAR